MDILNQIQNDLLKQDVLLSIILRKAKVLASQLRSVEAMERALAYREQVALCQRRDIQRRQVTGENRKNPAGDGGAEECRNIIDEDVRSNQHRSGLPSLCGTGVGCCWA